MHFVCAARSSIARFVFVDLLHAIGFVCQAVTCTGNDDVELGTAIPIATCRHALWSLAPCF